MSRRKNLDDVINGDRAVVRGNKVDPVDDTWDIWEKKADKLDDLSRPGFSSTSTSSSVVSYYKDKDSHKTMGYNSRCYEKHPALKLPGTDLVIYGGSCGTPAVKDANVYIGFDSSMRFTVRHWPWKKGDEIKMEIPDMGEPVSEPDFRKLVEWTRGQLDKGMKVHCGCIGGHGRTGTFLAALVSTYGEPDAISYVRNNYCHKAVESSTQVNFLNKHYGVTDAQGSKSSGGSSKIQDRGETVIAALPHKGSIWGC